MYKVNFFNTYLINKVNDVKIIYRRTDTWKMKPCKKNACFLFIIHFLVLEMRGCDITHHYYYLLSWCCVVLKLSSGHRLLQALYLVSQKLPGRQDRITGLFEFHSQLIWNYLILQLKNCWKGCYKISYFGISCICRYIMNLVKIG